VNISTTSSAASIFPHSIFYACWSLVPTLACLGLTRRKKNRTRLAIVAPAFGLLLLGFLLLSCGGGGANGGTGPGGGSQGTQPGTYTITVTGTAGSVIHSSPPFVLVVTQ
jgi:hypothetical protein